MKVLIRSFSAAAALFALPGIAAAHWMEGAHGGFGAGLVHPFMGLDHTLAMLAVGMLAAMSARGRVWSLPLASMAAVALGVAVAMAGLPLLGVETVIVASVIILGLALVLAVPAHWTLGAGVALMMFFHGAAHGLEAAQGALGVYAAGTVLGTGVLHGAGVALARGLRHLGHAGWLRWGGAVIAAGGLLLAAQ